jgi:hypothetical protein
VQLDDAADQVLGRHPWDVAGLLDYAAEDRYLSEPC